VGTGSEIDVDDGQDGQATRRLLQLSKWLHHGAPSRFTWQEVCRLDSWNGLDHSAFRAAFTVAKERLSPIGITIDFDERSQHYSHRHRMVFTRSERQALVLALAVAEVIAPGDDGAVELGLGIDRHEAELTVVVEEDVSVILDAIRARRAVELSHRGQRRRLDPYGLGMRNGRWYVAGRDHRSDEQRVFGLGRGGADSRPASMVGEPGAFEIPDEFDMDAELASIGHLAWRSRGAPTDAIVQVDAGAVPLARLVLGTDPIVAAGDPHDGPAAVSSAFLVEGPDPEAIVYRVLALGARARIVDRPEVVTAMRHHLYAALGQDLPEDEPSGPVAMMAARAPDPSSLVGTMASAPGPRDGTRAAGRLTPQRRLHILTVAVTMCEAMYGPVSISAIAEQAGATREQVLRALRQYELAEYSLLGDDGRLLDIGAANNGITIGEASDTVRAYRAWWLDNWRPLPREAMRLWIAASLVLALHEGGSAALRSAHAKLARHLGQLPRIVEEPPPPVVVRLRQAIASRRTLWLELLSEPASTDDAVVEVDPVRVRRDRGAWALEGRVRKRTCVPMGVAQGTLEGLPDVPDEAVTRFELSRIVDWTIGDRPAEAPGPDVPLRPVGASPIELVLVVDRGAAWMVDPFDPDEVHDLGHGRLRMRVVLPSEADLRTLLLRLGGRSRVEAPEALAELPRQLAALVLERYR
jgi:predicted DNA-binding transcriptional regulator YafY